MFHVKLWVCSTWYSDCLLICVSYSVLSDMKTSFSNCYFWIADMEAEKGTMGKG